MNEPAFSPVSLTFVSRGYLPLFLRVSVVVAFGRKLSHDAEAAVTAGTAVDVVKVTPSNRGYSW
jgi:hypothetical protein